MGKVLATETARIAAAPHDDVSRVDAAIAVIRDATVAVVTVVGLVARVSRDADVAIRYTSSDSKSECAD
jgi:hypothetical protein